MAGLPTVQVLLDDGTGTYPYDITGKAQLLSGHTLSRGRQDELSSVTAGQLSLVLDNNDGRFTLGSTIIASPSPIRPDAKIRVKVTANATTVTRFTGFMSAMPVEWPTGDDQASRVTITATDQQARAERHPLRSVISEEIAEDSPFAYYPLGEPEGAAGAGDASGGVRPILIPAGLTGAPPVFGTGTGPGTDGLTAPTFAVNGQGLAPVADMGNLVPIDGFGGFFATSAPPPTVGGIIPNPMITASVVGTSPAAPYVSFAVFMDSAGKLNFGNAGITATSYADGLVHHAFFDFGISTLYVDGVAVATDPSPGARSTRVPSFGGTAAHYEYYLQGTVPSAARILAHAQAGLTGFAGEAGMARLSRTAGYANLPLGTLDASLTNVPFVDITGTSAAGAFAAIADAEMGLTFFDGSGNLTFHNRNRPAVKTTPDLTIDANQLDPGTRFEVDMQGVVNYFETTAEGTKVTQVVRNTLSENGNGTVTNPGHGRYPTSKSYLVQTDNEALDRAAWTVANHAEPLPRSPGLKVDLLTMSAANQAAWLAVEPNHWIRVTGLPAQTPGGTTADLVVQGWSETLNGSEWSMTLNVVTQSMFRAFILDNATLGVLDTSRLYV